MSHSTSPSVLIVGGGAIGALIGGLLSVRTPSVKITLLARGDHLKAMRAHGLELIVNHHQPQEETLRCRNLNLAATCAEAVHFGPFDFVILTVKAHQLRDIALDWQPSLITRTSTLVTLQNGLPWWFFLKSSEPGPFAGRRIQCLDPDGLLQATFPTEQVIGGVALPASFIDRPGKVVHESGFGVHLGEGPGAQELSTLLTKAGFQAPVKNFREEIWVKLMGSAGFNPISGLTGATLRQMVDLAPDVCMACMREVRAVAASAGFDISTPLEKRLAGAKKVGDHKTSMLLDFESGKADVEIAALITSVLEVASWAQVPCPNLNLLHSLIQLKIKVLKSKL